MLQVICASLVRIHGRHDVDDRDSEWLVPVLMLYGFCTFGTIREHRSCHIRSELW